MIRRLSIPNTKSSGLGYGPKHEVYTPNTFRAIVDREKACAERNHHVFSLVTLSANGRGSHVKTLIETAAQRLRLTDVIGYIDTHRIGILLPYTAAAGAQAVVDDICTALESEAWQPVCEVSVFTPDKTAAPLRSDLRQLRLQV